MAAGSKTIAELQRELKTKKRALAALSVRRKKAAARLATIDKAIAELEGGKPANGRRKARRGRRKAARGRKKVARRAVKAPRQGKRKRATGKPLASYMREVMAKAPKGMRPREIMDAVTKAGYKSHSKDFYGIIAKTLLENDAFARVTRGVYKLGK